tara:strand:+ start:2098 stop:2799 length:702 start_codon:yes stop_codon:yes gene_type:complete
MHNRKFETFQQAFISINEEIINNPTYKTSSRIGDVHEISNYNYEVSDMLTYEFPNPLIGKLDYDYGSKFYQWMVTGSKDHGIITDDYPGTARFLEKPKSDLLPENFNTFYGPRILEQLPYIVRELENNPDSRRAVISILEKTDLLLLDKDETLEFPCADSATFYIREEKLNVHLHMRSQNMGQVLKLDMYLWARFTKELASELNVSTGTFTSSIVSAHVFKKDFEYLNSLITL